MAIFTTKNSDGILPFYLEKSDVRGRVIELKQTLDEILSRHQYPHPVAQLLAEGLLITAALSSSLKYRGVFTLHIKGSGPVKLLLIDCTAEGHMRGYAQFTPNSILETSDQQFLSIPQIFGSGYLAFTVDQGENGKRYQGIVELIGLTLSACIEEYFRQSEQLQQSIFLAVERIKNSWYGRLVLLQQIPLSPNASASTVEQANATERWHEAMLYLSTLKRNEILNQQLPSERLLKLLFTDQSLHIEAQRPLIAQCRCSSQKVQHMLLSFPEDEIKLMQIDGMVHVHCEICNQQYSFKEKDLLKQ